MKKNKVTRLNIGASNKKESPFFFENLSISLAQFLTIENYNLAQLTFTHEIRYMMK